MTRTCVFQLASSLFAMLVPSHPHATPQPVGCPPCHTSFPIRLAYSWICCSRSTTARCFSPSLLTLSIFERPGPSRSHKALTTLTCMRYLILPFPLPTYEQPMYACSPSLSSSLCFHPLNPFASTLLHSLVLRSLLIRCLSYDTSSPAVWAVPSMYVLCLLALMHVMWPAGPGLFETLLLLHLL